MVQPQSLLRSCLHRQHTRAQKFWPGSTIHSPFEGFEAADCPSVWPLLHWSVIAFLTASMSLRNVREVRGGWTPTPLRRLPHDVITHFVNNEFCLQFVQ
jgi:hypothetical protein